MKYYSSYYGHSLWQFTSYAQRYQGPKFRVIVDSSILLDTRPPSTEFSRKVPRTLAHNTFYFEISRIETSLQQEKNCFQFLAGKNWNKSIKPIKMLFMQYAYYFDYVYFKHKKWDSGLSIFERKYSIFRAQ